MKKTQITLDPESPEAKQFKKYLAEKAAFKKAVTSGNISTFTKKNGLKFDTPLPDSK